MEGATRDARQRVMTLVTGARESRLGCGDLEGHPEEP